MQVHERNGRVGSAREARRRAGAADPRRRRDVRASTVARDRPVAGTGLGIGPAQLGEAPVDAGHAWGHALTPTPLTALERAGLRALGEAARDPRALGSAIRRLGSLSAAAGLGVGMDPDLVLGLRTALDGLVMAEGRDRARRSA